MSHVFGPVPSRRLGRSLGIDPVPLKTCNLSCVYCQLGRTRSLANERREFFPAGEILRQVGSALEQLGPDAVDWLTVVASGEPTLYSGLGWLLRQVKALSPLPLAVITNGSLLHMPAVRHELQAADAVLPSLDAGSPDLFRRIARPHPGCTFEKLVEGLIEFRQGYGGKLWLEVMLLEGVNDSEQALGDIRAVVRDIDPDELHISIPDRPPAEVWVQPPTDQGLARAEDVLGSVAHVVHPAQGSFGLTITSDLADAVMDIITRHPMRLEELESCLVDWPPEKVEDALAELEAGGRAQRVARFGASFWASAAAVYPEAVSVPLSGP